MYLDTAVLVKLLVREADSEFYVALVDGQPAWSSQLVLVECPSALLRKEREGVTASLVERANAILEVCRPAVALRSLDAIHLASAERCQSWPLCSNDTRMRAAAAKLGLPLSPLPRLVRSRAREASDVEWRAVGEPGRRGDVGLDEVGGDASILCGRQGIAP